MSNSETMRRADFAKLIGKSKAYVTQQAKAGNIICDEAGNVLVEESKARLAATSRVDRQGVVARHQRDREAKGTPPAGKPVSSAPGNGLPSVRATDDPMQAFNIARAQNEVLRGEQLSIELAKTRGQLVAKDAVIQAQADLAAYTVAEYERLPDRLATQLAAETDPAAVIAMLQTELDAIRASIHKQATTLLRTLEG